MSLTDSDDDVEPGSSTDSLLRRIGRRNVGDAAAVQRGRKDAYGIDPNSLEAQLLGAGVTSPFNTWQFEETLRQQASSAVDRRHHEIEAFEQALHGALAEVQRVRTTEEARLAARVQDSTRRFHQQLEGLQQQFLTEVERLKRQTVSELHKQREQSEATIAARVRALQGELRHERPAGLSAPRARARDSSPGNGPGSGRLHASTRMRSAPSARGVTGSPAAAATPKANANASGRQALW